MSNFKDYLREILKEAAEAADAVTPVQRAIPKAGIPTVFKDPEEDEETPVEEPYCQFQDVPCGQGGGSCSRFVGGMWMCWSGCSTNNTGWVQCTLDPNQEPPNVLEIWKLKGLDLLIRQYLGKWALIPGVGPPTPPDCTPSAEDIACNQAWATYYRRLGEWLQRILDLGIDLPQYILNAICVLFPQFPFC